MTLEEERAFLAQQLARAEAGDLLTAKQLQPPNLTKFWQNYRDPDPDLDTGTTAA
jgi:hypothetical protein